jgi:hypothetical protein
MKPEGKAACVVRLIGDGHGNLTPIRQAVAEGRTVVHLGDLGFASSWKKASLLPSVLVPGGNHDDYSVAPTCPCYLGDFGDLGERIPGSEGTYFVRGALSIDRRLRMEGRSWWREEEIPPERIDAAVEAYARLRPRTVLSHDAPIPVIQILYGADAIASRTSLMLAQMLEVHEPARWFFGHHHVSCECRVGNTLFRCLGIDEALDVDLSGGKG